MPYISEDRREQLDVQMPSDWIQNAGELNYVLTKIIFDEYIGSMGVNYQTINDVLGVLSAISQEVYRRIAHPYEEKKMRQNGDIDSMAIAEQEAH